MDGEGRKKDYHLRKRVDLLSGVSLIVGTMIGRVQQSTDCP